jgi:hypothetical protein
MPHYKAYPATVSVDAAGQTVSTRFTVSVV